MAFRSKLEQQIAKAFDTVGLKYTYESSKLEYTLSCSYTPDFFLENGVILEVKGFLKPTDRRKMIAVKAQHPDLDIRFVFQKDNPLAKGSKHTYMSWAEKNGFPACVWPNIPPDWVQSNDERSTD
jgi:hypothetical protein